MEDRPPGSSTDAALCERCSTIDFDSLLSEEIRDGLNLGRIAQYSRGGCILCEFFLDILPDGVKQDKRAFYTYRLRSGYGYYHSYEIRLAPIPSSGLQDIFDGPGIPRILAKTSWFQPLNDQIQFHMVVEWLNQCYTQHKITCSNTSTTAGPSRLIDCSTRKIVPSHNHDYVTLSYVWGRASQKDQEDHDSTSRLKLPDALPKTIEDAITVTKRLGLRYLWVDKYCIDQSTAHASIQEIRNMDAIYRNSTLTIIDAAGDDPFHGLPGVRPGSRSPDQPAIRIGTLELMSRMQNPEWYIRTSKWHTRGWTYQEGLLSRRRLVFTSQQVFFECEELYHKEVLGMHSGPKRQLGMPNSAGFFPTARLEVQPFEIYKCLTEYSRRSLAREEDILYGILGLFKHMERVKRMFHVWGLPVYDRIEPKTQEPAFSPFYSPPEKKTLYYSLRWDIETPSSRRKGFPSWSWTGWFGGVKWPMSTDQLPYSHILLETANGELLRPEQLAEVSNTLSLGYESLKPYIHIQAYTTVAHRRDPEKDTDIFRPSFLIADVDRDNFVDSVEFSATTTDYLDEHEQYMAINVWGKYPSSPPRSEYLIVRAVGSVWERVAFGIDERERRPDMVWRKIVLG